MKRKVTVGIAWYRPQDWMRLLEMSEDREKLESSHAEWLVHANKAMRELDKRGVRVRRVIVDFDELAGWCNKEGVPVDASSRASYVAEKVRQEEIREKPA